MEEHIDLAVRVGALADGSLIAVKVGELRAVCCASADYLTKRGWPRRPDDLEKHDCITLSKSSDPIPWVFKISGQAQEKVNVAPRISVNTADAAAEAAVGGGGIAFLYSYQAAPHLAVGSLTVVLSEFEADPVPVNIVHPAGRLVPQKVQHFIDFASKRLRVALQEVNSYC
jgi:DNA-binding transcriptional LysR family regulator